MRVLLIDDEKTIRKGLNFAFTRKGFQVVELENALEAFKRCDLQDFDLIMLDLNLPFISGNEFIKHLKEQNINIPVLIMTSETSNFRNDLYQYLLPEQVISKDLTIPEIMQSIDVLLNTHNHKLGG